jgi:trehalose synthase-fused probable maltokinase
MASKLPPSEPLAAWLATQRWFGGKRRHIGTVEVEESIDLDGGTLHVLRVVLDDGEVQRYVVPLQPGATPVDALDDPRFTRALLDLVHDGGHAGAVRGQRTRAFPEALDRTAAVRKIGGEQSNTSVVVGDALIMKHFRRLSEGLNPDLEITRFLTETAHFAHTPALAGWLEYHANGSEPTTLAVVQRLVTGARDGWEWMLASLRDERTRGLTLPALRRLGEITARLHLALAQAPAHLPALAPEPVTDADVTRWTAAVTAQLAAARAAAPSAEAAGIPMVAPDLIRDALAALRGRAKARHHGDFHLGQTLYQETPGAWTIIDFEGEPLRPIAERRQKHAPLRDVAGLLRSIAYAAETVRATAPGPWIDAWERGARTAFLDGYLEAAGRAPFLPEDRTRALRSVAAFELEKAAYEVVYEANNRPDWIRIPLRGIAGAAAALGPPATSSPEPPAAP